MLKLMGTVTSAFLSKPFAAKPCHLCNSLLDPIFWRNSHGQPTPASHPHLLEPGYVTYAHTKEEFKQRRMNFMDHLANRIHETGTLNSGHIVIIPSASRALMSENIPYPFRQNSDFLYLTGFKEPDSLLLLHTDRNKRLPDHVSVLFLQEADEYAERWDGAKTDVKHAVDFFGVDRAYYMHDFINYMANLDNRNQSIAFWFDIFSKNYSMSQNMVKEFMKRWGKRIYDNPKEIMHRLRLIKRPAEIKALKKTCKIASDAMEDVMRYSRPDILESDLCARMQYECRLRGADLPAFPFVVAGGDRANTIHYLANNQFIAAGETVLMDAGCEFNGYCSDLSRTWPVSGKFSEPQRIIYEVVLSVQEELIKLCCDIPSLDELFKQMCHRMGRKLQDIGVIHADATPNQAYSAAFSFCPHHVSHYLGMDIHDTALITRGAPILPGMVITLEPGVYIRPTNTSVPEEFRGVCVRIEDDVFITPEGPEILTTCAKTIKEVEDILAQRKL